jgi:hypothetical protein
MKRSAIVAVIAFAIHTTAPAAAQSLEGKYSCVTDDKTEISDGDRSNGHSYFDLDGNPAGDQPVYFGAEVSAAEVRIQEVFAASASAAFTSYERVADHKGDSKISILAIRKDAFGMLVTLHFLHDQEKRTYGIVTTSNGLGTPVLRGGETFIISDIMTAHCRR